MRPGSAGQLSQVAAIYEAAPSPPAEDTRITEDADTRVTMDGDTRVTES